MLKVIIGFFTTLFIIYIVPIVIYGLFSKIFGIKTPDDVSPGQFLVSVFIIKIGVAIAITLFFYFCKNIFSEKWLLYVFIWWIFFVFSEVGQAIGPNYLWIYAIAGIISETIYLPLSVFILKLIIK